jgi:hypothetical protein
MDYNHRVLRQIKQDILGDVKEFRAGSVLRIGALLPAIAQPRFHLIEDDQTSQSAFVKALPTIALLCFMSDGIPYALHGSIPKCAASLPPNRRRLCDVAIVQSIHL